MLAIIPWLLDLTIVVARPGNVVKAPIKPVPIPAFGHAANSPRLIK